MEEKEKRKENRERERENKDEEQIFQTDGNSDKKKNDPKAVVFVPYTPNSALAKELRLVEESMENLTGTRLKIVEKAGIQLKRILVKANPWAGSDCLREDCLICQTRDETEEGKGKTCWKRNVIYETWCETCKDRDGKEAIEAGKDPTEVRLHKYIGETSRSGYTRGKNHLDDARLLSTGSHMLKHYLTNHSEESPQEMIFRMKILCFKRSAYERQIHESVLIQQNRNHLLLNSKSEFNRCSLPRLTVKLGDREMDELSKTLREEQKKEDELEKVIRDLKKQSKKRQNDGTTFQPSGKRTRKETNCSSYGGSREHLLFEKSESQDELADLAIDEAIRLCEDMDNIDVDNNCGDETAPNCGDEQNCGDKIRESSPEMTIKALLNNQSGVRERVMIDCEDDKHQKSTNCGDEKGYQGQED